MRSLTVLASALVLATPLFAADWPQFRGPAADGLSPETAINKNWSAKTPKELWRIPLGDQGYAGPAVVGGKVYILDHKGKDDVVRALDIETGKDVWTYAYPSSDRPLGSPAYGFTRPTPAVVDGRVFTISGIGQIHCLDAQTGKAIWNRDYTTDFQGHMPTWAYADSPVIYDGKLLVTPGGPNATLAALDPATGKTLWTFGTDKVAYSTPVPATLNGVKQYVLLSRSVIAGYAAEDGKQLWKFPWRTSYDVNAASPLILDDSVFVSSGYNVGCALLQITPQGPKELWKNKVIQEQFTSGVVYQGMIYSTTDPGDLVCVDPKTGQALWRQGGFEKGGIAAADGVLVALTGNGGELVMVQMAPDGYKELGRIKPLKGQCWTAPVIADGKLLARDLDQMVCLDIRP